VHERYRQTDRRQTDGWETAISEFECEFTFAKNANYHSKTFLKTNYGITQSLGRIAVLHTYMRPIVTDGVAWSVGLSH